MLREHPEKTATTMSDIVISLLEQVDETIYLRYLENLTAFGPRVTGTDACEAAAEYIYNQFENMGLTVRYHPGTTEIMLKQLLMELMNPAMKDINISLDESSDERYQYKFKWTIHPFALNWTVKSFIVDAYLPLVRPFPTPSPENGSMSDAASPTST
jgi:hypothetical protein